MVHEKRVNVRRALHGRVWVADEAGHDQTEGRMLDISTGGVAVLAAAALDVDRRYRFRFEVPGGGAPIECEGRVAYCVAHPFLNGYRTGMHFVQIAADDLAKISAFVKGAA
jgi:hypothetical protein